MSIPSRNTAGNPIQVPIRTFFVSTSCWGSRNLLQSDRMSRLLIEVLQHYRNRNHYQLHEFVIMPNHLHLLLSVESDISIEKAVQLIKGGFSYRAKRELGFHTPIWHRGFSEVRIYGPEAYLARRKYIHENPVKAGLVMNAADWTFSSAGSTVQLDPCPPYLRG